jgi:hypothetical protein
MRPSDTRSPRSTSPVHANRGPRLQERDLDLDVWIETQVGRLDHERHGGWGSRGGRANRIKGVLVV